MEIKIKNTKIIRDTVSSIDCVLIGKRKTRQKCVTTKGVEWFAGSLAYNAAVAATRSWDDFDVLRVTRANGYGGARPIGAHLL